MTAVRATAPAPSRPAGRPVRGAARAAAPSARTSSRTAARPPARASSRSSVRAADRQQAPHARPRLAVLAPPATGWVRAVVAGSLVFFLALAVAVTIQGQRISTQERYDLVSAKLERARERNRDLHVAVAQAESPEVVLEAARGLGMIEPGPVVAVPAGPAPTTSVAPTPTTTPSNAPGTTVPARNLPAPARGAATR